MTQYLYGSSIKGIQQFIFETNKLKEIGGASELIEKLSYDIFNKEFDIAEENYIMHAAGSIKLIADKEKIQKIVKNWPKIVEETAPGLTLSQAVVKIESETLTYKNMQTLEKNLKTARNKIEITQDLSPMAAIRSRRTSRPAIDWKDEHNAPRDRLSKIKQKNGEKDAAQTLMNKCFGENNSENNDSYPFDITDILPERQETGWLAVIHADGNSLGKIIQKMGKTLENNNKNIKDAFEKISTALENATITAAQETIKKIIVPVFDGEESKKYAFRPVIIGGDDLTIIIRADLAMEFTKLFLENFHTETKNNLIELSKTLEIPELQNGLTACAGIAYMKASYPFHYAVHLAEELCIDAKKHSKEIHSDTIPASLSFHKIQDSFTDKYKDIIDRELSPTSDISFKYGPYYLDAKHGPTIDNLQDQAKCILEKEAPKSGIRQWLTYLHKDTNEAGLWLERVNEIAKDKKYKKETTYIDALSLKKEDAIKNKKTHLYDVMSLASLSKKEETNND